MRKMQTAEKEDDNLNQKRIEKSEECGIVGSVEEMKDEERTREYHTPREVEEGTGRPGCRSKFWASEDRCDEYVTVKLFVTNSQKNMEISAMRHVKFVKYDVTDSVKFVMTT